MKWFFTRFFYLATRNYWLWMFVAVFVVAPFLMAIMVINWFAMVLSGAWNGAVRGMIDHSDVWNRDIDWSRANYEIKKDHFAKRFQERA